MCKNEHIRSILIFCLSKIYIVNISTIYTINDYIVKMKQIKIPNNRRIFISLNKDEYERFKRACELSYRKPTNLARLLILPQLDIFLKEEEKKCKKK